MRICTKNYFKNTEADNTWAIVEEPQSLAARTRNLIMNYAKPYGKNCLSLGCGHGRFLKSYIEKGAKQVVGADINRSNLSICKNYSADIVLCDIENLPFRSNCFDIIECVATMEHIEQPILVLKEAKRVLTEKGQLFVTWAFFSWVRIFKDHELRVRLVLTLRDLIPDQIGEKMSQKRFFGFKHYGFFKNKGFSIDQIQEIYANADLPVSSIGSCLVEKITLVISSVSKR